MTRISIVSDEISRDLGRVRSFLDRHQLHTIELRCVGETRVPDLAPGDRQTLRAWARNRDPAVLAVSPGLFKIPRGDRQEGQRHLQELLPRSLELALELEASFLVTFSFEDLAGLGADPLAVELLGAAAESCHTAGLSLLLENEPGYVACSGAQVRQLLERVAHPNLHVNWDPANSDDLSTAALASSLREIRPWLAHVHVKNGKRHGGERFPTYCALREGEIDWLAHLRLLRELGYDGHLGVETHHEPLEESSATVVRELRELLQEVAPWA
jgi:sugar phosphate isomerase/epimerase